MKIFLLVFFISTVFAEPWKQCDGMECMSKEELMKAITRYQKQIDKIMNGMKKAPTISQKPSPFGRFSVRDAEGTDAPTCNICNSNPCNTGTCVVDPQDPWHSYICQCPDDYTGVHCETKVECTPTTCGTNATCSVSNHQTNCVCDMGYSGNPKVGCTAKVLSACASGDPHYDTFDKLHYDYMSTCPVIYSEPCTSLGGGYDNFVVMHKSELTSPGSHVSYITEVEIIMYGQHIHFDSLKNAMYFNQVQVGYPFYWPSVNERNITLDYKGNTFSATTNQLISVTLYYSTLCLYVPDVPEFHGAHTLCGLAGNIDGNPFNDVVYRNGTVYPVTSNPVPPTDEGQSFNHALDTWIVDSSEFNATSGQTICATGEMMSNNTNCDITPAITACAPILNAMNGVGPFAQCQGMGNATIQQIYDDCTYDVCHGSDRCLTVTDFVQTCMKMLPDTNLGPWRNTVNCLLACTPHSHYSSCTSACPQTCSEHDAPSSCTQGCVDGCQCDYGYVVDNSITSSLTCIPIEECGCQDPAGNIHGAHDPWLDKNCTVSAVCTNGTYNSEPTHCSNYGTCTINTDSHQACQCEPGFTGDGFNCTDIDECLDPNSCGQQQGYGNCTNTIGSYYCTCNPYQTGHDCQNYQPTRHCADWLRYWNQTKDGVYNINVPEELNGRPAYSDIPVYCDMTSYGGGWTLMSHDNSSLMLNKTYAEYQEGFGSPSSQNHWLGLDLISEMTSSIQTSLMVKIGRCVSGSDLKQFTDCTYPTFKVYGADQSYPVFIPEFCNGTEQSSTVSYDGWVRWKNYKDQPGPAFLTFDKDAMFCSGWSGNSGWWFDTSKKCGSADLNGHRYACSIAPEDIDDPVEWAGNPVDDAFMFLRPASFPNY